jgi:hypothetical protein
MGPSKQMQIGKGDTVFVSSPIGIIGIPPIFMGNTPSQSTSVSGLKILPPQVASPREGEGRIGQVIRINKTWILQFM